MTVVPLKNPAAFNLPLVKDLFDRAFAKGPVDPETARRELSGLVEDDRVRVLVARDGDKLKAMAVLLMPSSPLFPLPNVYHFYSDGPAALGHSLTDAVVETAKRAGYNGLHAFNGAGTPDKVWTRKFRRAGSVEHVGSAFRIEFDGRNSQRHSR